MILFDPLHRNIKSGWYRSLQDFAPTFAGYGGQIILLPPAYRTTWSGPDSPSMGYDMRSVLDIGQWEEMRGGTARDLQELATKALKLGVRLMLDIPGQYGGFPIVERNAQGKPDKTLAYQPPELFNYKRDGSFQTGVDPMGLPIPFEYGQPDGYLMELRRQTVAWLVGVTGAIGVRGDKGSSIWPQAQRGMYSRQGDGINIGEFWTGNNAEQVNYINTTNLHSFDFGSHFAYRAVTQGAGLDALVYNDRLCHVRPDRSWIFVRNHDTEGDVTKLMGWWYFNALTEASCGACIFGPDWDDARTRRLIQNYMWIGSKLCWGPQRFHVVSSDVLIWSRDGNGGALGQSKGVLCGISRDPINTVWVWSESPFKPNTELKNYAVSGGPNIWTNQYGWVELPLPPNSWNRADNAVAYGPVGQDGPIFTRSIQRRLKNALDFSSITVKL